MLIEEAKWIGKEILSVSKSGQKILNVGSSSLEFRTKIQPHIEKFIFRPLKENNIKVIHTDIVNQNGVDIVGDLTSPEFILKLKKKKYDLILCSNLLEHIEEIKPITTAIEEIVSEKGIAIITVPYNYPYHLDPIDTMYRPNPKELSQLFASMKMLSGEILNARSANYGNFEKNYFQKLLNDPRMFVIIFLRFFLPFYKFKIWKNNFFGIKNLFKDFSVTCVVLAKK